MKTEKIKYLLQASIECNLVDEDNDSMDRSIALGLYDDLGQAISEGNQALTVISNSLGIDTDDYFTEQYWGLISSRWNCGPVGYTVTINKIMFGDIRQAIVATFDSQAAWLKANS